MRFSVVLASLLLALGACSKKENPAPTPPAPTGAPTSAPPNTAAPAPDATPTAEPEPAPAPSRSGYIAWSQDPDGELETTLFLDGAATPLVTKAGVVAVAVGDEVWQLGREASSFPLKPCDEPGEAGLVALAITGVEPPAAKTLAALGDPKDLPKENESWIHHEALKFVAQAGPLVLVHHEATSDTCPVPAGGAVYDTWRILDFSAAGGRAPTPAPFENLYGEAFAELQAKAIAEGQALIKKAFPTADNAELARVLKLYTPRFDWSDEGKLVFTGTVAGYSAAFSDDPEEEGEAAERVTLPAPDALATLTPPPAVLAYWVSKRAEGRGFSPISGKAFDSLERLLASAP